MPARPLAASVASRAPGCDERSTQAYIQHVENPSRGCHVVVMPENIDVPGATGSASAKQEIQWCTEVASKIAIFPVATSSSRRTDPA